MKKYEFNNAKLTRFNRALARARDMLWEKCNFNYAKWNDSGNKYKQSSFWDLCIKLSKILCDISISLDKDQVLTDTEKLELTRILLGEIK